MLSSPCNVRNPQRLQMPMNRLMHLQDVWQHGNCNALIQVADRDTGHRPHSLNRDVSVCEGDDSSRMSASHHANFCLRRRGFSHRSARHYVDANTPAPEPHPTRFVCPCAHSRTHVRSGQQKQDGQQPCIGWPHFADTDSLTWFFASLHACR